MKASEAILGSMTTRHGRVVWEMDPDDARELADVLEEALPNHHDLGHRDVAALRRKADLLDPREATA